MKMLELSNTLRELWEEHIMWTRSFIISTANNLPDLKAVTERLLRNPSDFAKIFEKFYSHEIAEQFEILFTEHLTIAADLVNAAKAGNSATVEKVRKEWYENAEKIAVFLSSINGYWQADKWRKFMFDHLKMTEDEAVQILNKKSAESVMQFDKIQAEALKMADYMSYGIIKQFF